jgi:hypothetical protein
MGNLYTYTLFLICIHNYAGSFTSSHYGITVLSESSLWDYTETPSLYTYIFFTRHYEMFELHCLYCNILNSFIFNYTTITFKKSSKESDLYS